MFDQASDEVIVLNAHVDGWFDGAGDNGDGLAVLVAWTVLGLSLVARSMPWEPRP